MMKSYEFFIQTERKHIDFINKVMEAYEGLGIVRTLDPKLGKIKIISTEFYADDVREVVEDLDKRGIYAKIVEEGPWKGIL
jgi:transcriptional regulatory protein LevR